MAQPILQKKIKIVSLDSKEFDGPNGPWTKYNIKAHDGQYYGSTDANWFSKRKVGEVLVINYYSTIPTANKFGKMVSYNNIVTAPSNSPATPNVAKSTIPQQDLASAIMQLINLVKTAEVNIIDAIRLHCGNDLKDIEKSETLEEQLEETPIIEDENNVEDVENPF